MYIVADGVSTPVFWAIVFLAIQHSRKGTLLGSLPDLLCSKSHIYIYPAIRPGQERLSLGERCDYNFFDPTGKNWVGRGLGRPCRPPLRLTCLRLTGSLGFAHAASIAHIGAHSHRCSERGGSWHSVCKRGFGKSWQTSAGRRSRALNKQRLLLQMHVC